MEGNGEESTLFTTGINPKYHDCSVFQCLKSFNCNFSIKGMLIYKSSYFGDSKTELELIEMILSFKTPVLCKNRLVQSRNQLSNILCSKSSVILLLNLNYK